jgi:hypothetical protein
VSAWRKRGLDERLCEINAPRCGVTQRRREINEPLSHVAERPSEGGAPLSRVEETVSCIAKRRFGLDERRSGPKRPRLSELDSDSKGDTVLGAREEERTPEIPPQG